VNTKLRAVICDIDGTLLDGEAQVPAEFVSLVAQLQARKVMVSLASARPALSVLEIARQCNLQAPIICHNGSLIIDQHHQIYRNHTFDLSRLEPWQSRIQDLEINTYAGVNWYITHYSEATAVEEAYVGVEPQLVTQLPRANNMVVLFGEHQQLKQLQQQITHSISDLEAVFSHPMYLHIGPMGVNKGFGVAAWAQLMDIQPAEIIAFGDAENDMSMLKLVGHGVIMANATPQLKAQVPNCAPPNFELGVVSYLKKMLAADLIG
jgi:Cof subfamily protein (haloacid dehalogenase superfamily)